MYMKRDKGKASKTKESSTLGPLYDVIEIMGDHLVRVYEYRGKAQEKTWIFKQPCQDRLMVEAIAGFFMTGEFPFRCPMNELMKVSAGRFEF